MFNPSSPKTPRDYLRIFLTGMAMGSADIVPGVSGGTMAFILGIYEALLDGIKSFNLDLVRKLLKLDIKGAMEQVPWQFLGTLGAGIVITFLLLANLVTWLLENEPQYLFAFFFGLILASIIAIAVHITHWNTQTIIALIVGTAIALLIVTLRPAGIEDHSYPTLFFSGAIAIMAMILPGISGSFILLLLGQYEYVLNQIKAFNLPPVIAVALGCAVGLVVFVRFLSWLLKTYHQPTIAALTGFMIGSLWKIWPFREAVQIDTDNAELAAKYAEEVTRPIIPAMGTEVVLALVLCLIGFMFVTALDHMQSGSNPVVVAVLRLTGNKAKA